MMKQQSTIFFILSLIFFTLLINVFRVPSVPAQPQISFKELTFDFGDVEQDTTLTHIFEFTNTGDEAITIEDVKAS